MSDGTSEIKSAHDIELGLRKLKCISTMPSVASSFLKKVGKLKSDESAAVIESDPALTTKVLSILDEKSISFASLNFSMQNAVNSLTEEDLNEAVFSVDVLWQTNLKRFITKKELTTHSIAVACCAKQLADIVSPRMNSGLAYTAGLLHNIGNLALFQAMPKSFDVLAEQAKEENAPFTAIQKKYLGMDYTLIGKRLCQQWRLPKQIEMAVWLHQSDIWLISQHIPEARIAQIVQFADCIARQYNIGQSGSFSDTDKWKQLADSLKVNEQQLTPIAENLREQVTEKINLLGLESADNIEQYCKDVHRSSIELARKSSKLSAEHKKFAAASSQFNFAKGFVASVTKDASPMDIAEKLAIRIKKFYQTGKMCLYLINTSIPGSLDAVVLNDNEKPLSLSLDMAESPVVPPAITNSFDVLDAENHSEWIFQQLETEFNYQKTKIAPVICRGKAIGAIIFELNFPVDLDELKKQLEGTLAIAGSVLGLSFNWQEQQRLAETFIQIPQNVHPLRLEEEPLKNKAQPEYEPGGNVEKETGEEEKESGIIETLAEMAAGAAHELNNPLLVASGRAQLLAEKEEDKQKRKTFNQIRENINEISGIIDELMRYADPQKPRKERIGTRQLIDEAIQFTSRKKGTELLGFDIQVEKDYAWVEVDSVQVVMSVSNILINALESYANHKGPVTISADAEKEGFIRIEVADQGVGMDEETLMKATYPFFSNKPAGRQRGMGLAHAKRLITLNGGELDIHSTPDIGTVVSIYLPAAS